MQSFDVPPKLPRSRGAFLRRTAILIRLPGRGLGHNARLGMARHALNVLPEKRGLSPSNAKGPVSDDGAFRTFLRWQGMLSDPANFSIRHALIWFQGPPLLALRARCWPPARASHRRKLWHQIRPSKLTKWAAAAAPHTWAGLQLVEAKLTARVRANP